MKRSSRNALIVISVAGGIIIGFLGFIWFLNKSLEKVFKNFGAEDMSFEETRITEPEICDGEENRLTNRQKNYMIMGENPAAGSDSCSLFAKEKKR